MISQFFMNKQTCTTPLIVSIHTYLKLSNTLKILKSQLLLLFQLYYRALLLNFTEKVTIMHESKYSNIE